MMDSFYKSILPIFFIFMLFFSKNPLAQETPKQLYDQGIKAGCNGNFSESSKILKIASEQDPDNMSIFISLSIANDCALKKISNVAGKSLFNSISAGNNENWDESLSLAKRVCDLAPEYATAYVHLGTVYIKMLQLDKGDHYGNEALKAYKKAIEIESDNGLIHYNIGVAYGAKHQWRQAHEHLKRASTLGIKVPSEVMSRINKEIEKLNILNPSSSNVSNNAKKQKGFFSGLFGPLLFIVKAPKLFFSPGTFAFDQLLNETWGQGSVGYKIGFVLGAIIILSIPGFLGSSKK